MTGSSICHYQNGSTGGPWSGDYFTSIGVKSITDEGGKKVYHTINGGTVLAYKPVTIEQFEMTNLGTARNLHLQCYNYT